MPGQSIWEAYHVVDSGVGMQGRVGPSEGFPGRCSRGSFLRGLHHLASLHTVVIPRFGIWPVGPCLHRARACQSGEVAIFAFCSPNRARLLFPTIGPKKSYRNSSVSRFARALSGSHARSDVWHRVRRSFRFQFAHLSKRLRTNDLRFGLCRVWCIAAGRRLASWHS
jgi:hypothetical protein